MAYINIVQSWKRGKILPFITRWTFKRNKMNQAEKDKRHTTLLIYRIKMAKLFKSWIVVSGDWTARAIPSEDATCQSDKESVADLSHSVLSDSLVMPSRAPGISTKKENQIFSFTDWMIRNAFPEKSRRAPLLMRGRWSLDRKGVSQVGRHSKFSEEVWTGSQEVIVIECQPLSTCHPQIPQCLCGQWGSASPLSWATYLAAAVYMVPNIILTARPCSHLQLWCGPIICL